MSTDEFDTARASAVAEQNYSLQKRLAQLEADEELQKRIADNEARLEEANDTSGVDRARRRNNTLKEQITSLEKELKALQSTNVVELQHEYHRLDTRRGHLLNEITSLRRVIANQSKDVRRATQAVNNQQEVRRMNREENATSNADIQLFREKREALATETQKLIREEHHLEAELEALPGHGESYETIAVHLREDNAKRDEQIQKLEHGRADGQGSGAESPDAQVPEDLQQLRDEYVRLNNELQQSRT